jgi:hypothetical protein
MNESLMIDQVERSILGDQMEGRSWATSKLRGLHEPILPASCQHRRTSHIANIMPVRPTIAVT